MTIKDAEQLTGLTPKSIRLYEQKGLLKVERNEENDYRNYTEENIQTLKWIKLYRYLDFSIEEIKELLHAKPSELSERLQEKYTELGTRKSDLEMKKTLLATLLTEAKNGTPDLDGYPEIVAFAESEDYDELQSFWQSSKVPSRARAIWISILFCGPIGWFFINLASKRYDLLTINAILAFLSVSIITAVWKNYFTAKRLFKKQIQAKNKEYAFVFPMLLAILILCFACFIGGSMLLETFFAPNDWLFYEPDESGYTWKIAAIVLSISIAVFSVFYCHTEHKPFWKCLPWVFGSLLVLGCSMYVYLTDVTFVTTDSVVIRTPFDPQGETYSYSEITKVEAGFDPSKNKSKSSFFYRITVGDKTVTFSVVSGNGEIERYATDSHLELLDFDKVLMQMGIEKQASDAYAENCEFDQVYVDRFLQIVRNQPQKP